MGLEEYLQARKEDGIYLTTWKDGFLDKQQLCVA